MSSSFSASQFNSSYSPKKLGNWEVPATGRDRKPKANHPAVNGPTQFIVNDNGCAHQSPLTALHPPPPPAPLPLITLTSHPPSSPLLRTLVPPSVMHPRDLDRRSQAPARHGQEQEDDVLHDGLRGPGTSCALARQAPQERRHVYETAAQTHRSAFSFSSQCVRHLSFAIRTHTFGRRWRQHDGLQGHRDQLCVLALPPPDMRSCVHA